ncbi:hypothetical protein Gpo141_00003067 [Globisporangium polare]
MVAGSLLWTLRLLVLTVDPKDTTNRVMDTGTYDGGSFCLLVEPALSFVLFGVAGLVLVGSGHGYLLLKIARVRTLASIRVTSTSSRTANSSRVDSIARRVSGIRATLRGLVARAADDSVRSFVVKSVAKLTTDNLAFADSDARKKAHIPGKLVDTSIQFVLLQQNLETRYLIPLILAFTTMLSTFNFDRAKFAVNVEMFPEGRFEC